MDQQVNDTFYGDLVASIDSEHVAIQYNIRVDQNQDSYFSMSGRYVAANGPAITELDLCLYLDQMTSNCQNLVNRVETSVSNLMVFTGATFIQRTMYPFRSNEPTKITYKIRLKSYKDFAEKLHKYALTKVDKEFTEVLEAKLSED